MKVVRFMSDAEKEMYLSGAKMVNATPHSDCKSTSVGFCFAELTDVRDADKWLRKLYFNTRCEWCVEFDADRFSTPLIESKAVYAGDDDFNKTVVVREWCTTSYSLSTHPYTRIGRCPDIIGICGEGKLFGNEFADNFYLPTKSDKAERKRKLENKN